MGFEKVLKFKDVNVCHLNKLTDRSITSYYPNQAYTTLYIIYYVEYMNECKPTILWLNEFNRLVNDCLR